MYFDYAATSVKRKEIIKNLIDNLDSFDGNPSSIHAMGKKSKQYLEDARDILAKYINADPKHIYFTSGASESNNAIIRHFSHRPGQIISSNIEHKSVLEALKHIKNEVQFVETKESGQIDIDDLKKKITDQTKLICIMYVNNETGVIQQIEEIANFLKDKDIWFHVDAVQALGHFDIDVEKLHVDSMSFSSHKIGGMHGFGILYSREKIDNLIYGGIHEFGFRAGTSNVIAALSMAHSLKPMDQERSYVKELKDYFLEKIKDIPHQINGDLDKSVDHIVNIYFPFVKSDLLLTYLDMHGFYVSAGSACNSNTLEFSYVIENMYDKDRAKCSIRFSFGYTNTIEQIDKLVEQLEAMYRKKKEKS